MNDMSFILRPITESDNAAIASIIRDSLREFGANKPGTAFYDESTDHLSDTFIRADAAYFVVEQSGNVVGGGGIYPTEGLPEKTCELVKLYLSPGVRGAGLGKKLMELCLDTAKLLGYEHVYLETMPELSIAVPLYEKYGFRYLAGPIGNSGHYACTLLMLKDLN